MKAFQTMKFCLPNMGHFSLLGSKVLFWWRGNVNFKCKMSFPVFCVAVGEHYYKNVLYWSICPFTSQKCSLGSPEDFLSRALDPPQQQVIGNAMNLLRKIGACQLNEPKLTPLGQHLAALPVNVKIGKMLIFGAIFGCLDPVVSKKNKIMFLKV